MRLPTQPNQTPTPIFNPSLNPYTFVFAHDEGKKEYTLPAYRITTLPHYLANHAANQLADVLIQKRGIRQNYQLDKENILKEIFVEL